MNSVELLVERMPRPLLWATLGHVLLTLICFAALRIRSAPLMGVHPALKPLKFAFSIALFLATLGILIPSLSISPFARSALAWLFASTMLAEMLPIVIQSLRGTTSHFNRRSPLDAAMWHSMVVAIVAATLGMLAVALLASLRPLIAEPGRPLAHLCWFSRGGLVSGCCCWPPFPASPWAVNCDTRWAAATAVGACRSSTGVGGMAT